jgi:hypothetical protein
MRRPCRIRYLPLRIADLNNLSIGNRTVSATMWIRRDAVFETVRSAGIFGDVSSDRAGGLTRRVGRVVKTVLAHRAAQRGIDDARLDDRETIFGVDGKDSSQPIEPDQNDTVRERSAG